MLFSGYAKNYPKYRLAALYKYPYAVTSGAERIDNPKAVVDKLAMLQIFSI